MEDAAVHAVDGLAGTPNLIFVLGILVILAGVAIKAIPMWRDLRQKKLDADTELRKQQLDSDAKFRQAEIDIERDRELRKMEEAKQRHEREKENAAIMSRSVDAQERSTIAINESTAQMAILAAKLEMSQQGSMSMRDTVDDMAVEVHDIHLAVVK